MPFRPIHPDHLPEAVLRLQRAIRWVIYGLLALVVAGVVAGWLLNSLSTERAASDHKAVVAARKAVDAERQQLAAARREAARKRYVDSRLENLACLALHYTPPLSPFHQDLQRQYPHCPRYQAAKRAATQPGPTHTITVHPAAPTPNARRAPTPAAPQRRPTTAASPTPGTTSRAPSRAPSRSPSPAAPLPSLVCRVITLIC